MEKEKVISFKIPERLHRELKIKAARLGRKLKEIMTEALEFSAKQD